MSRLDWGGNMQGIRRQLRDSWKAEQQVGVR